MRIRRFLESFFAIGVAALLSACASGYSKFYQPAQGASPEMIAAARVSPPTGQPIIERAAPPGEKVEVLLDAYTKRGYAIIGSSSFNSGSVETEDAAIKQGVKVGADLVLILDPRYTGSTTSLVPLTVPTTSTSYSSGTATAYGPGGTVTAYGSGTTTTYGTSTTMIPITVNRSDYGAAYFVKRKWRFGATWRDLNDAERRELQSNKGVYVSVIVDNSPAYRADVLAGDIILAVDGQPVLNHESLGELIRIREGRSVVLSLYRKGTRLEKAVQLSPL